MLEKISCELFNQISFFLGGSKKVTSLEEGAKNFGGATKFSNGIISNVKTDNFININSSSNVLRVFIPSTLDVNNSIDNIEYVKKYYNYISNKYNNNTITTTHSEGSWFSDTTNSVVVENITILELHLKEVTQSDINFFLDLGLMVKEEMAQDAVSVMVNSALCLV